MTRIWPVNSVIANSHYTSISKRTLSRGCLSALLPSSWLKWSKTCKQSLHTWSTWKSRLASVSLVNAHESACTRIAKRHRSFETSEYTVRSAADNTTCSSRRSVSAPASLSLCSSSTFYSLCSWSQSLQHSLFLMAILRWDTHKKTLSLQKLPEIIWLPKARTTCFHLDSSQTSWRRLLTHSRASVGHILPILPW